MIDDNSRKRRRQDTYFPPRKRARIEELVEHNNINNDDDVNCNKNKKDERVNHVQQNKKKIVPIVTTNFTTLKRRRRSSSECKRLSNNKQTNKRYRRRPLIRLLTVNKSKPTTVGASSSFREVIAQGKVTHILRECHAKAFDSNHGDNDTSSSTKDSLYGNGGENIMNAACVTFKSSPLLMPKEFDTPRDVIGKSNTASSPTSVAAIDHLEEEKKQIPKDDDDVEDNDGLYYMLRGNTSHFTNDDDNGGDSASDDSFASCQDVEPHDNEDVTHTVTPRDDDTTNTARDELDRQQDGDTTTTTTSPTNLSVASTQTEYSELTLSPDDQDDTNSPYSLPFHFMSPEEQSSNTSSSFTSTPRSNISFSFAEQSYSPQRGLDSTCILDNNEYSPIKPRPSKRPIMTTPFPSSISLLPPSSPSEDEEEDASIQYDQSPPFNFMSEDYMTQQSDFNDDYEYMPRASLSSLIKYILRFIIEWLLRVLIGKIPSNNDDNINNINPPTPPKPRDNISSSRLVSAVVTSQPSLCRRERQVKSSRTSIPTPTSNANVSAVDHQNEQTPASPSKCTKTAVQHHVKKIPTTKPPSGWKNLFKPKEGEWKCKSCFYINPPEAMTCDSCTAIKDRPPGQVLKSCLRDKSTNIVGGSIPDNNAGKTPFKARREKREYDDSSIGNEENDEESDSYSSYESDSEEEVSETYSEDADEEESYRGAPEWTGENDEEETDDEEAEEESSPNKRVKRVVTSPSQALPPPTPAPPQTIRKPTRSSYELVNDPSHNSDTAATTFTSSKRVKRDCTPQDLTSSSASSIAATQQPGIIKRNLSDTMSEDIPVTSNKMARETSGESMMDDVSVIYSEMDTEQRPGLIQRKSSDNMSELSH